MVAAGGARPALALGGYLTTDGESQVVKVRRFGADSPFEFHHLRKSQRSQRSPTPKNPLLLLGGELPQRPLDGVQGQRRVVSVAR